MISIVIVSKDEPGLDDTLTDVAGQAQQLGTPYEIVVVDASLGQLDHIRRRHERAACWHSFRPPPGVAISIAHQRNAGVQASQGEVIVFTDAGCRPQPGWLTRLVEPLGTGENVTVGTSRAASGEAGLYGPLGPGQGTTGARYLPECGTRNMAFRRAAFDAVGGFDETFAYGSDVDFSWRLRAAGYRIRDVPTAVLHHDFGTWRRQLRRSYVYGRARLRLHRKHHATVRHVLRTDPMVIVYPVFLLGLPLTLVCPAYPALLLIPAWRNRSRGPVRVVTDHLTFGAGVLAELMLR